MHIVKIAACSDVVLPDPASPIMIAPLAMSTEEKNIAATSFAPDKPSGATAFAAVEPRHHVDRLAASMATGGDTRGRPVLRPVAISWFRTGSSRLSVTG